MTALRKAGLPVVDLSADFRLRDLAAYEQWYGPHKAPELFGQAVFGIPELHRDELRGAGLVAAAGCYVTAALLPLLPFLRADLVQPGPVIVDAKSGVSGAGRNLEDKYLFAELDENVQAYKVASHRHVAEMEQEASLAAGRPVGVTFVPQLLPVIRGIAALRVPAPVRAAHDRGCARSAGRGLPGRLLRARAPGGRGPVAPERAREQLLRRRRLRRLPPRHARRPRHPRQSREGRERPDGAVSELHDGLAGDARPARGAARSVAAAVVIVPYTTALRWLEHTDHIEQFMLAPLHRELGGLAIAQVRQLIGLHRDFAPDQETALWAADYWDTLKLLYGMFYALQGFFIVAGGVTLLVGAVGVMNIMLVVVGERTAEVGLRKALGARGRDVFLQFVLEAVLVSGLAGGLGVAAGWLLLRALAPAFEAGGIHLPSTPDALTTVAVSGALILVAVISGVVPALRAARIPPPEALRAY